MSRTHLLRFLGSKLKLASSTDDFAGRLLPEAVAELKKAIAWYSKIRPELGTRFARGVDETIAKIARTPHHFPVIENNRRRAAVHRFPHGIFFILEPSRIVVLACFHGKRNPRRWITRQIDQQ